MPDTLSVICSALNPVKRIKGVPKSEGHTGAKGEVGGKYKAQRAANAA